MFEFGFLGIYTLEKGNAIDLGRKGEMAEKGGEDYGDSPEVLKRGYQDTTSPFKLYLPLAANRRSGLKEPAENQRGLL